MDVTYLHEKEWNGEWKDREGRVVRTVDEKCNRDQDGVQGEQRRRERGGENVVDRVDVFAEAIDDAAERCAVEEGHRCTKDAVEKSSLQVQTRGRSDEHL